MTTPAARVRASLADAYASLPPGTKNRKKLAKSLKSRRTTPKREQTQRPFQDMADGHVLLGTSRAQRQTQRTGQTLLVEGGRRTEAALRTPVKPEDGARGVSPFAATTAHHQLHSNAALLSQTRQGIQLALQFVKRINTSLVGAAGQQAIEAGHAADMGPRRTSRENHQAYMTRFMTGPCGESLFPANYADVASAAPDGTLFQVMPITEYPLHRQLVRENVPAAFAQREALLHDPEHSMPHIDVPCEMREHLQAFERPPAAGQRLCIRAQQCWNMRVPTHSSQANYIGRAYLSRRELQHLQRTGKYPAPPPDLERKSAQFETAVRSVRLTDTMDTFCAPVTFGKCLNCIKHDMAEYMKLMVSRQQEPPLAPVNPFRVECGPGQYRRECCWEQVHNGKPTGIAGFFPRLSDTYWTEYEVSPASYELSRRERLRAAGSDPMDLDRPQPLLQLLLGGGRPPPTPQSALPDIFEEDFEYEQLLPDGRSTKRVQRRLPRTYFGEFNMDF